jgi:hypothetical protein
MPRGANSTETISARGEGVSTVSPDNHFRLGFSPDSTKYRMADARVWSFWAAHRSRAVIISSGIRTPTSGSVPVAGRPRVFLRISLIDFGMKIRIS